MANKTIQKTLVDQIRRKLKGEEKLVDVIAKTLKISKDASYRRINAKVELSISEINKLQNTFNISLNNFQSHTKNEVLFHYRPLSKINFNFENYLINLRSGLKEIKSLDNPKVYVSVNETPLFQLFNFPHLTRFKFFFWAKSYLKIPEYENMKFKREKIDKRVLQIGIEAHNIYNSIPSIELYCPETLRGLLRQIQYYFETETFEDSNYVLEILDNFSDLVRHIKHQAKIGHKFVFGNTPNSAYNSRLDIFLNDTYLPDNTYYVEYEQGAMTYFTHNIMNFIMTENPYYCIDTKMILDRLIDNSSLISVTGTKERDIYFSSLEQSISNLKRRVALDIELKT